MATRLSISLSGLRRDDPTLPWSGGARAAIAWASTLGVRSIQLDASVPGVRARELDRSARRDLAASLRRAELDLSGLDLWIPGEHLLDPAHVDRAVSAIAGAIGLAGELAPLLGGSGRIVSLTLPPRLAPDVLNGLASEADRHGVRLADHAWPPGPHAAASPPGNSTPAVGAGTGAAGPGWPVAIGIGLDPAAVALSGDDIGAASARVADRVLSARLCDLSSAGRVLPGSVDGRLDLTAYKVGLSLAPGVVPVVIDLRGLPEQDGAARRMAAEWAAR